MAEEQRSDEPAGLEKTAGLTLEDAVETISRWQDPKAAIAALGSLSLAVARAGSPLPVQFWLTAAENLKRQERSPVVLRSLHDIADIIAQQGGITYALDLNNELVAHARERGDSRGFAHALWKVAQLQMIVGNIERAEALARESVAALESIADEQGATSVKGTIADIAQIRGQLDEALRIRQEEQLPVYERLGDVRSKAITQSKIADILQARGQLDEALRIRQEEELPVYERLGDVREKAAALFKIAQMNLARMAYPEAMDGLAEAYAIVEGLQEAQGLAHVGRLYGQVLCAAGERARGHAVLEKAAGAFTLLGQDDEAQAIQTIARGLQDGSPS
ncbi:MAG: hypothetical protein ACREWG_08095 [Gammaproteobacteria bacterium]